jgi:hypothetical protein
MAPLTPAAAAAAACFVVSVLHCHPSQTITVLLVLLPLLILGCIAALLLLAFSHNQLSTNSLLDYITPPARKLPPHPTLIGPGGEPLLLPDRRALGLATELGVQGSEELLLVAGGRQLKGRDRRPLRLVLGGDSGRVLLDEAGVPMLGLAGRPLEVSLPWMNALQQQQLLLLLPLPPPLLSSARASASVGVCMCATALYADVLLYCLYCGQASAGNSVSCVSTLHTISAS